MNVFTPRTFSTDWEHYVVDRLNRCVGTQRLLGFAEELSAETSLPINVDKESLEFALGINHSFEQCWARILQSTDRAAQLLHAYELDLFPAAGHPLEGIFNSAHIHVGTLLDETAGVLLENQLFRYVPAFSALAANSPVVNGMRGEYKSYRIRYNAMSTVIPGQWRFPATAQKIWGTDAGPKLYLAPTFEVRAIDCASSRRLLAELAVFVAAFVHTQGEQIEACPPDAEAYHEYLLNRWTAARDGLQATFRWRGTPRPVTDLLDEMLDACREALQMLGASRATLSIIHTMLEKRRCQADMVLELAARYADPYLLAAAYGKMLRQWEWFEGYLTESRPLPPLPALSDEDVLRAHLRTIGEGTPYYRVRELMSLPPPTAQALIDTMVGRGWITREESAEHGVLLSRVAGRESSTRD